MKLAINDREWNYLIHVSVLFRLKSELQKSIPEIINSKEDGYHDELSCSFDLWTLRHLSHHMSPES